MNQLFTVVTDHRALCYLRLATGLTTDSTTMPYSCRSTLSSWNTGQGSFMLMWMASQGRPGRESRTHLPWEPLRKVLKIKNICLTGGKTRFKLMSKAVSNPLVVHPTQEGVGLAGKTWGWKPIEHFNILCFSVHCHAVITLSHELMC